MTGPMPSFGVSCWPGARAESSVVEVAPGQTALSVYLDPIDLVVHVPPFPDGPAAMVRFLRGLARASAEFADQLDSSGSGGPARHRRTDTERPWFGGDTPANPTDQSGGWLPCLR